MYIMNYRLYRNVLPFDKLLDSGSRNCVIIGDSDINIVIPAKAGIQNLSNILDSVSRFACTE
jgi:hypothetical protein